MEEPPKRGRGRPKKEKTEPEEPKRPRGRPRKEKTEPEEPKRPRGRPKKAGEPVKEVAGKILITETAPASPEGPSAAGGGKPFPPPPPPPAPAPPVVAKPVLTETTPMTAEEIHRSRIDLTLPSPPSEVELPSDEEEAERITRRYYAQLDAQKERKRLRDAMTKLEREQKDRERREEQAREEDLLADKGWRRYKKFRESFATEEEYNDWERKTIANALKDGRIIRFFTFRRNRYVAQKLKSGNGWEVYDQDWLRAREENLYKDYSVKFLGYVGSGFYKDIPFPT